MDIISVFKQLPLEFNTGFIAEKNLIKIGNKYLHLILQYGFKFSRNSNMGCQQLFDKDLFVGKIVVEVGSGQAGNF